MTKANFIILFMILTLSTQAQSIINLGKFPTETNDEKPILTSYLLKSLNWESVKEFSRTNDGHYAYTRKDSLLTEYEYVQQGRVASFEIVSYKGMVLEFNADIFNTPKPTSTSYFDKNVWLEYTETMLPNLPDSLKLTIDQPKEILKAYYQLLGVDARDEYGWICEYSTVGMAPEKRLAVIKLLSQKELLWQLFDYPNIQTQLYVTDALIFDDHRIKEMIEEQKELLKNEGSKSTKDFIKYLESELLTKSDWQKIYNLRDSNQMVKTCGNMGSYKVYESNTSELLSKKAIADIPNQYKMLEQLGYFR